MANGVLASLNRILESQERREQTKLQTSLAMMEMGQKRRMQDFEMATKQLEIGSVTNKQLQLKVAGRFLDDSGFNSLIGLDYTTPKDDQDPPDLNKAVKDLTRAEWGKFSDSDAQRIVSAVWLYRASQDPSAVIDIMSELRTQMDMGKGEMFAAYKRGSGHSSRNLSGYKGIDDAMWQAQESIRIGDNIINEYRQISEGDFKIESDLGLEADQIAPSVPKDSSLAGDISDQSKYQEVIIDDIRDKNEQIRQIQQSKRQAEITEKTIQDRIAAGTATDKEKEQLLTMSEIQDAWDKEIQVLQSGIAQVRTSADALAEMEIKELVRKVGKPRTWSTKARPRAGERMIAAFEKGGTFDLLEQLPEDLVASIVSGDRYGVERHPVMFHQRYVNDKGERIGLDTKTRNKLTSLTNIVRKARALEAGKSGTGYVKSIDLPYEPPPPDPFVAPVQPPVDDPDVPDPITNALNALIAPQSLGLPPPIK